MKNCSIEILLVSFTMFSASLHGQTNVQSYTDADLNQGPRTQVTPSPRIQSDTAASNVSTTSKYPDPSPAEMKQFNDQVNAQIRLTEQRMAPFVEQLQGPADKPMHVDRDEFEAAVIDLDVKKTLASKFEGSPSLKSPKVRQALLQVLSKKNVTEEDLKSLQTVVDEERQYTYP